MNRIGGFLVMVVVAAAMIGATSSKLSSSNDDIYNQIVIIKGTVQILNHPELGKTPASGQYLVFQHNGCKQCLVATFADANGNYKIYVGRGRYKVIVQNPAPPTYDMIAPGQPRYVEATPGLRDTEFDIKLVVPAEK
jgi:hypothetical protein